VTNEEICRVFKHIADLLEVKGENPFKARAYRNVMRSIEELNEPLSLLVQENRLNEIAGAGEAIRKKITELAQTGRLEYYDKLKAEFPDEVTELLGVSGIGPKTARLLIDNSITSLSKLKTAIADGSLLKIATLGEKAARKIASSVLSTANKR
jgi:DNA polymerase (family 10)